MLMRFDPFREIDRLSQLWGQGRQAVVPLDAYRHGDRFVLQLDVPGVNPVAEAAKPRKVEIGVGGAKPIEATATAA